MSGGARRLGLRRRLDASALRWQARLDTAWVDRTLPWAFAAGLAVLLTAIGLAVQRQLDGGPVVAAWTQAAWNLAEGDGPTSSIAGGDMIADQWAFATLPLLWLGRWISVGTLMAVVQPLCLGLAAVPIWRMARDVAHLRMGSTTAVLLAYGAAPILYTANLTGWSAVTPAVPALAWATWFGQRRRWVAYGLCIAVALLARADVGLVLVALGLLGITMGDRRSGTATAAIGLAWSCAFMVIVAPAVPRSPMTVGEAVLARGTAPLAVLRDPLRLVTDLVLQPNVGVLVVLVGPFLFLPLVVPRFAMPALPPIVLGLVGEAAVRDAVSPGPGTAPLPSGLLVAIVPLALATIVALARIGQLSVTRIRVDHRIVAAMLIATTSFFVQVAPASPFNEPWSWGGRDEVDGARLEAVEVLEDAIDLAPVTVSPQITVLVAARAQVEIIPIGPPTTDWRPEHDAVVLDTTAVGDDGEPVWAEADVQVVLDGLADDGFAVTYHAGGIFVLLRDPA